MLTSMTEFISFRFGDSGYKADIECHLFKVRVSATSYSCLFGRREFLLRKPA